MKLIRSCQDKRNKHSCFYFSVSHSYRVVLLQLFTALVQVVFTTRSLKHQKYFVGFTMCPILQIFVCIKAIVGQKQPPLARDWEMCRSQSLMCYLSQMLCVLLVPLACAAGRHALWLQAHNGTGAALLPVGTALQWLMEAQE